MEGLMRKKKRVPNLFSMLLILVLVITSPVWAPIMFFVFCYIVFTAHSIRNALEEDAPLEWLTWQQIKYLAGARPSNVARFAICILSDKKHFFISRRRELAVAEKISRRLGMDIPNSEYPRTPREVIFYEFRVKFRDTEKGNSWMELFRSSFSKVLQPA